MKIKFWNKKTMKKIWSFFICLGMILGSISFSPTVVAKDKYETQAFDKKVESREDFKKGEFKNTKIKEDEDNAEIELAGDNDGEYVTQVIKAPFAATHIGLHWKENVADKNLISAYVRTSADGENFSDWMEAFVEMDENKDDNKNEEIFAALMGVAGDSFAQAKFILKKENSSTLKNFTMTFINSGEESKKVEKEISFFSKSIAGAEGTLKTSPGGQNLNVVSREEWGANETYRLDRRGKEEWPRSYHGTRKIVIHHTAVASSNGEIDFIDNKAEVRAIYYYHAVTQNWGDIGYNALVDAAGNVYEGRYGTHGTSLTRENPTPEQIMELDVEAAHTAGYNSGSFGVAAMGDFRYATPTTAQLDGLRDTLAYVADSRGINIQGYSDFRRYDGSWDMGMYNVIDHRDATATECPGPLFTSTMVQAVKTEADNLVGILHNLSDFDATVNGAPISGTSVGSATINFDWDSFEGAIKYQYVLERVFGTTGVANDSEPWQEAWFNQENPNVKTTTDLAVAISGAELAVNSSYVFYVRGLDANDKPISNTRHVNFTRNSEVALDETAPVVNVTSPVEGASITGVTAVEAIASDDVEVTKVDFYANNVLIGSDNSLPYSINWDSKTIADGTVLITAKAFDLVGNQGMSNAVSVTVSNPAIIDTIVPIATINSPSNGAIVSGIVAVKASAVDDVGVTLMELFIDGKKVTSVAAGNISYNWNTKKVVTGVHNITVRAYDAGVNQGAASITVIK